MHKRLKKDQLKKYAKYTGMGILMTLGGSLVMFILIMVMKTLNSSSHSFFGPIIGIIFIIDAIVIIAGIWFFFMSLKRIFFFKTTMVYKNYAFYNFDDKIIDQIYRYKDKINDNNFRKFYILDDWLIYNRDFLFFNFKDIKKINYFCVQERDYLMTYKIRINASNELYIDESWPDYESFKENLDLLYSKIPAMNKIYAGAVEYKNELLKKTDQALSSKSVKTKPVIILPDRKTQNRLVYGLQDAFVQKHDAPETDKGTQGYQFYNLPITVGNSPASDMIITGTNVPEIGAVINKIDNAYYIKFFDENKIFSLQLGNKLGKISDTHGMHKIENGARLIFEKSVFVFIEDDYKTPDK